MYKRQSRRCFVRRTGVNDLAVFDKYRSVFHCGFSGAVYQKATFEYCFVQCFSTQDVYKRQPETNRVGMNYTIPASVSATDAGDVSITAASVTEVYYLSLIHIRCV